MPLTAKGRQLRTFDTRGRNNNTRVRGTQELLNNLSVLNFQDMRNNSSEMVREKSRDLVQKLCDKEKTYYEDEMENVQKRLQEKFKNTMTKQSKK